MAASLPPTVEQWRSLLKVLHDPKTLAVVEADGFKIDWDAVNEVSTRVILQGE